MFGRVLITGGAGFIGTHLARYLREVNPAGLVTSLDLLSPTLPVPGVRYLTHDVRKPFEETIDESFDIVFNLAAVHRTPGHPDGEYFETNVAGALNATGYCERHGIETMLFTSSISVYGPSEMPLDESSPIRPNHAYGRSKWLAEEIHCAWLDRTSGRKLVIARPAVVFGEGENGNFTRLAKMLQRGIFVLPGRKDTRKAGFYVKELVQSMFFALDRPEALYRYNFAYPECLTISQICDAFGESVQFPRPLAVLPRAPLELAVRGFELLNSLGLRNGINRERMYKLISSTYVLPTRLIADNYRYRYTYQSALQDWVASDPQFGMANPSIVMGQQRNFGLAE